MKMIYNVDDKPKFGQLIVFAIQQLLAIMAATLVVPVIINGNAGLEGEDAMSSSVRCRCGNAYLCFVHKKKKSGFPWFVLCLYRFNDSRFCRCRHGICGIFRAYNRCHFMLTECDTRKICARIGNGRPTKNQNNI